MVSVLFSSSFQSSFLLSFQHQNDTHLHLVRPEKQPDIHKEGETEQELKRTNFHSKHGTFVVDHNTYLGV